MSEGVEVKVGDVFKTNEGGYITVVSFEDKGYFRVEHNDEYKHSATVEKCRLFLGSIKNPYHRSVCSVGYLGVGEYKTQKDKVLCQAYKSWKGMLKRCYTEQSGKNFAYSDCTVHEDWHNFQVFAEWYYGQKGWNCSFQLDKDLFSKGVKIYSLETCCLIPAEVNYSIISITNRDTVLGYYKRRNKLYEVQSHKVEGSYKSFINKEDAIKYYNYLKQERIQGLALKWKGKVDDKVFDKLMNWKF